MADTSGGETSWRSSEKARAARSVERLEERIRELEIAFAKFRAKVLATISTLVVGGGAGAAKLFELF